MIFFEKFEPFLNFLTSWNFEPYKSNGIKNESQVCETHNFFLVIEIKFSFLLYFEKSFIKEIRTIFSMLLHFIICRVICKNKFWMLVLKTLVENTYYFQIVWNMLNIEENNKNFLINLDLCNLINFNKMIKFFESLMVNFKFWHVSDECLQLRQRWFISKLWDPIFVQNSYANVCKFEFNWSDNA